MCTLSGRQDLTRRGTLSLQPLSQDTLFGHVDTIAVKSCVKLSDWLAITLICILSWVSSIAFMSALLGIMQMVVVLICVTRMGAAVDIIINDY